MLAKEYLNKYGNKEQIESDKVCVIAIENNLGFFFHVHLDEELPTPEEDYTIAIAQVGDYGTKKDYDLNSTWDDKPVGHYEPVIHEKGVNETVVVKEGEVYYMIKLNDGGFYDTESQSEAMMISKLCLIEKDLNYIKKQIQIMATE